MPTTNHLVACSLGEREQAERTHALARDLFAHAEHVDELPDGFSFQFSGDGDWLAMLFDFAVTERRCCGFFRFELVFEPGLGPIQLRLTGPAGARDFIRDAFGAPAQP